MLPAEIQRIDNHIYFGWNIPNMSFIKLVAVIKTHYSLLKSRSVISMHKMIIFFSISNSKMIAFLKNQMDNGINHFHSNIQISTGTSQISTGSSQRFC